MTAKHIDALTKIVSAAGGQRALAARLTARLQAAAPNYKPVSQQRIYKWISGSSIDPAICPTLVSVACELAVPVSLYELHQDARLIWCDSVSSAAESP